MPRNLVSKKSPIYDNVIVQAPDGIQLCRVSGKRANWFLNHPNDIAYEINNDDHRIIRLKFEPSGRSGVNDPFLQSDKQNKCVICGIEENLTKHHVVPWTYRKHLPKKHICNCFHDIVPTCVNCHINYEATVHDYKLLLCKKYDVSIDGILPKVDKILCKAISASSALERHKDKMPPERCEELIKDIEKYLGRAVLNRDIELLSSMKCKEAVTSGKPHGQVLAEKLTKSDLQEFYEGWREHFVKVTNPKFMPEYWSINRRVKGT